MATVDYKKELENAAKNMILVHEPDLLIRMIVRMLVQKVKVQHAGILLYLKDRDTYILTVSGGATGLKIPAGFARMDADNALIRFFKNHLYKHFYKEPAIIYKNAEKLLNKNSNPELNKLLQNVLYQMEIFEATVCIPSYYQEELLGILLLGQKKNNKEFCKEELSFFIALASDVSMAIRNAQLFRDLELELEKRKKLFIHTTIALAAAIDAKDHYTHGHTARVTSLSLDIARKLAQKDKKLFTEKFMEDLHIAGLLHDIGKIGIPENILNKEGALTLDEMNCVKEHPIIGVTILQPIKELQDAITGVKYHHERFDGSGYPEGLRAEQIPIIAAIISVADTFDAMTTDRPYHRALLKDEAVREIKHMANKQFSPQVTAALAELYQEGKI